MNNPINTSLHFEAPADLSIGHVTIQNELGPVTDWIATPQNRSYQGLEMAPGIYTAEIAPPGTRSQLFVFEVKRDTVNTVVAPLFSTLSAGGNNATFSGVSDPESAIAKLHQTKDQDSPSQTRAGADPLAFAPLAPGPRSAAARKQMSIGISREQAPGTESWRAFEGDVSIEITGSGLDLRVTHAIRSAADIECRARLSIALEKVRVERLLMPLYRGGTNISVASSQLATSDVEIRVTPTEPELRALYRALDAGTQEIAAAVHQDILVSDGIGRYLMEGSEEPWGAMLAALLAIRFPDIFGDQLQKWAQMIRDRFAWAYDAHVIFAKYALSSAPASDQGRRIAARQAIAAIGEALKYGSPYFSYSNQLVGEMLDGLSTIPDFDPGLTRKASNLLARWRRYLPLQRGSGATFSWTRRDPVLLRKHILRPDAGTTGALDRRHSRIVFRGRVGLGQISMDMEANAAPKDTGPKASSVTSEAMPPLTKNWPTGKSANPPALQRPILFAQDPNKGRFGSKRSQNGYTLSATFHPARSLHWVSVTLTVRADEPLPRSYSDIVSFCLHPTFDPQWINAVFRGREASITVKSWGGFTVGAWLPAQELELECDLAELPDAPKIIREL